MTDYDKDLELISDLREDMNEFEITERISELIRNDLLRYERELAVEEELQ